MLTTAILESEGCWVEVQKAEPQAPLTHAAVYGKCQSNSDFLKKGPQKNR